jgi:hypothetical protein
VRIGIATGVVVVGDLIGEGAAQEQGVVPPDVVFFAGKRQRPMQLLDHRPKRAGLMLWRTVKDNLGVRRFAKLHAKRLQ